MKLAAGTPAQQRKQLIALGVLVVIGVGLYFWYPWTPALTSGAPPAAGQAAGGLTVGGLTAEGPAPASNTPAAGQRGAATASANPEPVKLAALGTVNEATGGTRDPFGFGVPPRPPTPPPPVYVAPPPQPPPPPPPPVGPPPRPQIPVKFLGVVEDPSRPGKLVTLSINGAIMLAREGDVVDGKYRLVKVGLESIVMAYLDGQGQQTIRQSGT